MGQQMPNFKQYHAYQPYINPGTFSMDTVIRHSLTIGASYRQQWLDIPGSPLNQLARADYVLFSGDISSFLVGGSFYKSQTGAFGLVGGNFRTAVQLTNPKRSFGVSLGISGGAATYRMDFLDVSWPSQHDGEAGFDPTRPSFEDAYDVDTKVFPDINVGLFIFKRFVNNPYVKDNVLFGGVSFPQLVSSDSSFMQRPSVEVLGIKRHLYIYAVLGYQMRISPYSSLEFSGWLKKVNSLWLVDGQLRYFLDRYFWLGAGYSFHPSDPMANVSSQFLHLETGIVVGENIGLPHELRISYSYDYLMGNGFQQRTGSTHEINVLIGIK